MLKLVDRRNPFRPTTTADLNRLPRWSGPAKSIEEISRLSDDVLRQTLAQVRIEVLR
jgi:hypothetical protein